MDKYYTLIDGGKDGSYCILFANHHGLEKEEVESIFLQFGRLINVKFHNGNKNDICFVRYESMEDAVRAVEGLKDDPKIRLLEHKKKKQRNEYHSERAQGNGYGQQNCNGIKYRQNIQENDQSAFNRNGNFKEDIHHGNSNDNLPRGPKYMNENQKQIDFPSEANSTNGNQKHPDLTQRLMSAKLYQKPNNLPHDPKAPNQGNLENNDKIPDLVDCNEKRMTTIKNQSIDVPELVTASGKTLGMISPKKQIIIAQEVIVANIPIEYGSPYMLHLFDRYEPLAISHIMVEPRTSKRYCHVYFKSSEESQQVEKSFDKKLLLDQSLVVLRSNQLLEFSYFE